MPFQLNILITSFLQVSLLSMLLEIAVVTEFLLRILQTVNSKQVKLKKKNAILSLYMYVLKNGVLKSSIDHVIAFAIKENAIKVLYGTI